MANQTNGGNNNGKRQDGARTATRGAVSPGVKPEAQRVGTYREGQPFPGRIGRTWDVSEPAFPVPPKAPPGAPNILT